MTCWFFNGISLEMQPPLVNLDIGSIYHIPHRLGGEGTLSTLATLTSSKLTWTLVRVCLPSGLKPAPPKKAINLNGLENLKILQDMEKRKRFLLFKSLS